MTEINHATLKALAKQLGRPLGTLEVTKNDPFTAGAPARLRDAEWCAGLWERFDIQPGAHIRRVHYVLVSQLLGSVKLPDGTTDYVNLDGHYHTLAIASLDARYLGLISAGDLVDRRNAEPAIYLTDEEGPAFRGWLSRESYTFVAEITENFGRPTAPIVVSIGHNKIEKTSDTPQALGMSDG